MQYVVIGTSPTHDTSVVAGPYRSYDKAREAASEVDAKGYVSEICELLRVEDIELSPAWG